MPMLGTHTEAWTAFPNDIADLKDNLWAVLVNQWKLYILRSPECSGNVEWCAWWSTWALREATKAFLSID